MLALLLLSATVALHTPELTCRVRNKQGELVRSETRKQLFRRMTGRKASDPECTHLNHIVPLHCGGCDVPSNMECMSEKEWKRRTGAERRDCGRNPGGEW